MSPLLAEALMWSPGSASVAGKEPDGPICRARAHHHDLVDPADRSGFDSRHPDAVFRMCRHSLEAGADSSATVAQHGAAWLDVCARWLPGGSPVRGVNDLHRAVGQRVVSDYAVSSARAATSDPAWDAATNRFVKLRLGRMASMPLTCALGASLPRLSSGPVPVIDASCAVLPSVSEGMA